jgi:ribosomal protein S6E (S10)
LADASATDEQPKQSPEKRGRRRRKTWRGYSQALSCDLE